ncbi:MAG: 6-bladed beta-propeller [Prevotellaceae bacterium]|jgi:hypothetical protein|nr:6-bladed beta-propeller [Prevotellaceae bacterium]
MIAFISCAKEQEPNCLITEKPQPIDSSQLSSIIKDYKFVRLETSDNSLIGGQINKIKKHQNKYYVLSDWKEILIFNDNGTYVSKISKIGPGPDEYTMASDFDCSVNNDIVVLAFRKIIIYDSLGILKKKIPISITGFNIKCMTNGNFLVCTSGEEYVLYVLDSNGDILKKVLKHKPSTRIAKLVPFINISPDQTLFQIGSSNNFISYNMKENDFSNIRLLCNNECISSREEDKLIEKYHSDYFDISTVKFIYGMASCKNHLLFRLGNVKKEHICIQDIDNNAEYTVLSIPEDDITYSSPNFLLNLIEFGDAEDCFISYFYPTQLDVNNVKDEYNDTYKNLIRSFESEKINISDENPILFEFVIKNLTELY